VKIQAVSFYIELSNLRSPFDGKEKNDSSFEQNRKKKAIQSLITIWSLRACHAKERKQLVIVLVKCVFGNNQRFKRVHKCT